MAEHKINGLVYKVEADPELRFADTQEFKGGWAFSEILNLLDELKRRETKPQQATIGKQQDLFQDKKSEPTPAPKPEPAVNTVTVPSNLTAKQKLIQAIKDKFGSVNFRGRECTINTSAFNAALKNVTVSQLSKIISNTFNYKIDDAVFYQWRKGSTKTTNITLALMVSVTLNVAPKVLFDIPNHLDYDYVLCLSEMGWI